MAPISSRTAGRDWKTGESRKINNAFGGLSQVLGWKGMTNTCSNPEQFCWVDRHIPHFPRKLLENNDFRTQLCDP